MSHSGDRRPKWASMGHKRATTSPSSSREMSVADLEDEFRDVLSNDKRDSVNMSSDSPVSTLQIAMAATSSSGSSSAPVMRKTSGGNSGELSAGSSGSSGGAGGGGSSPTSESARNSSRCVRTGNVLGVSSASKNLHESVGPGRSAGPSATGLLVQAGSPVRSISPVASVKGSGRSDVLGSGSGNYGHGSVMRGGGRHGECPPPPIPTGNIRVAGESLMLQRAIKNGHKVHSHFDRSLESGPYTLKYRGSMWGYKRFYRRAMLETSDYLKDDCLKINCTVGVVASTMDCVRLHTIQVPDSDIGQHLGTLLDSEEGSDVVFDVCGEKFHAHKLLLAARSPVFQSQLFEDMHEDNQEIVINDLEPKVFKALLHFIYRDCLMEEELTPSSTSPSCSSSVAEMLPAKLLAASHKYGLSRLRLICESYLCKDISVNTVARMLALAVHHQAMELKAACLKFAAENLAAVM